MFFGFCSSGGDRRLADSGSEEQSELSEAVSGEL
jgi:hypothetical protein